MMPYREIHIGKETFITRVSDAAVNEWLERREHLRNRGYPDRPPDIDTPLTRSWILHPNEKTKSEIEEIKQTAHSATPVYTLAFNIDPTVLAGEQLGPKEFLVHKLIIGISDNPVQHYSVRLLAVWSSDGESAFDKVFFIPEDEMPEKFDQLLETASKLLDISDEPLITTYAEYEAIQKETEIAEQELDDYYGKPLVN